MLDDFKTVADVFGVLAIGALFNMVKYCAVGFVRLGVFDDASK